MSNFARNLKERPLLTLVVTCILLMAAMLMAQPLLDPTTLTKYIDPLPIPGVLTPVGTMNGAPYYEVHMREAQQQLHSELPPTTIWGYEGQYPGPSMVARSHERLYVKWINDLPTTHILPIDTSIMGAGGGAPEVRTVVHLHGGHVPAASDGWPEDWFTPGGSATYFYPNNQDASLIWYHDHALGITRLNVYAGLAGAWVVTDNYEARLNLPSGQFDVPLILQDRSFYEDGSFYYPYPWQPEFFGDVSVVNGKVWPYIDVQPRKYRFRFLNGCTSRFFDVKLLESDASGNILSPEVGGPAFHQIGCEGGFLDAPVTFNDPNDPLSPRLLIGNAERADVIIDFAGYEGRYFVLSNDAPTPFQYLGQPDDEVPLPELMLFRVGTGPVADPSSLPTQLRHINPIPPQTARLTRDMTLKEYMDMSGNMMIMLNGMMWRDPITEKPQLGTTEIWRMINLTNDTHPMHLHLVMFQVMQRQPFDVDTYNATGQLVFTGPAEPPYSNENGWKDTFKCPPGMVSSLITKFQDYTGKYVWHCHILEHEEHEMMRPFEVISGVNIAGEIGSPERQAPITEEPTYAFALNSAFPSPFNPTTTISFTLPEAAPTSLVVYNTLGQTVATLADGWQGAGLHRVTFDGSKMASGVYFYRLTSGSQTQTQKMILMK